MRKTPSRVELRPLTLSDQDEFRMLVQASSELHLPWMQLPATAEEFQVWMRRFDDGTNLGFLVRVRETGAAAGTVNINLIIRGRYQGGVSRLCGLRPVRRARVYDRRIRCHPAARLHRSAAPPAGGQHSAGESEVGRAGLVRALPSFTHVRSSSGDRPECMSIPLICRPFVEAAESTDRTATAL